MKYSIFLIMLFLILLTGCTHIKDISNPASEPVILSTELPDIYSDTSPEQDSNDAGDTNPLGKPVFNIQDESTWECSLVAMIQEEDIFLYGGIGDGMIFTRSLAISCRV